MSLVAYGSSDESDSEEISTSTAAESKRGGGGLFSLLPAPKTARSAEGNRGPSQETQSNPSAGNSTSSDDLNPQKTKGGLFSSLPKPRKRTEPVKISVPLVQRRDVSQLTHLFIIAVKYCDRLCLIIYISYLQSDSDDDEPARKRPQAQVRLHFTGDDSIQFYLEICSYLTLFWISN